MSSHAEEIAGKIVQMKIGRDEEKSSRSPGLFPDGQQSLEYERWKGNQNVIRQHHGIMETTCPGVRLELGLY